MVSVYADALTVRRYVKTSLSDADINLIGEDTDSDIDNDLGAQDANNKMVRRLAAYMTAYAIKVSRDPQSTVIGPFEVRMNPTQALLDEIQRLKGIIGTRCELI